MLSQILQVFRSATEPLCAETLAQILDKDPVVVGAMLQELSAMGRIQVTRNESACEICRTRSSCGLSSSSTPAYILITESMADPHL